MRDSQRSRVYNWEASLTYYKDEHGLSLAECQALANEVSAYYGYPSPRICDGRGHHRADYHDVGHRIDIPRWLRSRHVVLHEVAHGLTSQMCGLEVAAHGPEFVRIAMTLYRRWAGARLRDMLAWAVMHKVKVASPHIIKHNTVVSTRNIDKYVPRGDTHPAGPARSPHKKERRKADVPRHP